MARFKTKGALARSSQDDPAALISACVPIVRCMRRDAWHACLESFEHDGEGKYLTGAEEWDLP
jgi:hypothetical protein